MPDTVIELAHGGGGRLSRDFVRAEILPRFGSGPLGSLPDGATLPVPGDRLVFTTDSYVVQPLEFPGGNIGHLAVHGTVNDLAVCGAAPLWLSLGLILEEGLSLAVLRRVLDAVRDAAAACGAQVVTGDTKVVGRGQCDALFLNTSGIGRLLPGFDLGRAGVRPGDRILVTGPVGDHGMAVMACRHGMNAGGLASDTAPVHRLVQAMLPHAGAVRFMRDPTRGGLATVLNEIVEESPLEILVEEPLVPLSPGVRALSELLGLDPLHVASEGRMIAVCAPAEAPAILEAWNALPEGRQAAMIGSVHSLPAGGRGAGRVVLHTVTGGRRLVDVPRGELLPRIC